MATLDDLEGNDLAEAAFSFGDALIEIAEMHTDSRLDEAQLFLRARKLAQERLKMSRIDFVDNTFGGKISP